MTSPNYAKEYGEWWLDREVIVCDPAPGTWEELEMAYHLGMIDDDRYNEFDDAWDARGEAALAAAAAAATE